MYKVDNNTIKPIKLIPSNDNFIYKFFDRVHNFGLRNIKQNLKLTGIISCFASLVKKLFLAKKHIKLSIIERQGHTLQSFQ